MKYQYFILVQLTLMQLVLGNSVIRSSTAAKSVDGQGQCQCGVKHSVPTNTPNRIIGGSEASSGEFPWFVSLATGCGGTILSQNWILTAAHCTEYLDPSRKIEVYYNLTNNPWNEIKYDKIQSVLSDRFIAHEEYDYFTFEHDLALIHLSTPIPFGKNVGPVCLPWDLTEKEFHGINVTAAGFGDTDPSESEEAYHLSEKLLKVTLQVLEHKQCKEMYESRFSITQNMICAYTKGKDTCQGDSGGILEYLSPANGRSFIVGVTSFGDGCAKYNSPGVYVRVTEYLNWIQATTGETFCQP